MQHSSERSRERLKRETVLVKDIGRRAADIGRKLLNETFSHTHRKPPGLACAVVDLLMQPRIMHMGDAYVRQTARAVQFSDG